MSQELIQALQRQEQLLAAILESLKPKQQQQMGFHNNSGSGGYRKVFCNRSKVDCLWYFYPKDAVEHIPILEASLTGYLKGIKIETVERLDEETEKLHVYIDAGQEKYILEAGAESVFAKSILASISTLNPAQILNLPITVIPKKGTNKGKGEKSVLLCSVYIGGEWVKGEYSPDTNWNFVTQRAIDVVTMACGVLESPSTPQPKEESIPQPVATHSDVPTPRPKQPQPVQSYQPPAQTQEMDAALRRSLLNDKIGEAVASLGWTQEQAKAALFQKTGKKGRSLLTDQELEDFCKYIEHQAELAFN